MIKLHSFEDFVELLDESAETLKDSGEDLNKLYESFREPGAEEVELNWHDVRTLLRKVRFHSYLYGQNDGRSEGFQDALEQVYYNER